VKPCTKDVPEASRAMTDDISVSVTSLAAPRETVEEDA
jgi:hypothetical protein